MSKPCTVDGCDAPKRKGHPKWCNQHWLWRQPMAFQVAECAAARAKRDALGLEPVMRLAAECQPEGRKWCAGCQRFRRIEIFGGGSRCKPCAWVQSHEGMVRRTYGLEAGVYEVMLADQGGRCAICRNRQLDRALAVEHNHTTGEVRGLVCVKCNHEALGALHDSADLALRAYAYLIGGWPAVKAVLERTDHTVVLAEILADAPPF